jgi:dGTPase
MIFFEKLMNLNTIFSAKRTGYSSQSVTVDARTEYQRDFDRIIFSSAFRRLQNKTQVFPLPGSVFVHNRLTHSLEVASVGRSLGSLVGDFIAENYSQELTEESTQFYRNSLYNVISSACLCHDIGNPAFGHSGEDAVASYFLKNESTLKPQFSEKEWTDFVNFEGNSNAIRILTQQQQGKSEGGLQLTYSTLASIIKYPCEATGKLKGHTHRKKFGFFQAEKETFLDIAAQTKMVQEFAEPLVYQRHPFVWLVEAADDICYTIIDLEDAHRLGIIEHSACMNLLLTLVNTLGNDKERVHSQLEKIKNKNDKVAYLRAKSIGFLTVKAKEAYQTNFKNILSSHHQTPLVDEIDKANANCISKIIQFSVDNIYNHHSVVEIENAGYNVMYELLSHFIQPILKSSENRSKSEKMALKLLPQQFIYEEKSAYFRVLGILDFVSGMTDNYATDLYRKIKGIDIGMTI